MPANQIAYSDIGTKFYHKVSDAYAEFLAIKNVPATGDAPATIDVTALKDAVHKKIAGRQDPADQAFTFNRTPESVAAAQADCDGAEHEYLVVFSDGSGVYYKGIANMWLNELSVDSVSEATFNLTLTDIQLKTAEEIAQLLPASV
jgi:hypothetical protein